MAPSIEPGVEYEWFKLGDLVDRAARLWPGRAAVIFEDRRWTWAELAAEVDRVAKGLMAAEIRFEDGGAPASH